MVLKEISSLALEVEQKIGISMKSIIIGALLALTSACSTMSPVSSNYASVDEKFKTIRHNRPMLVNFLDDFPKGADLHNHASGAAYIEYGLIDAAKRGYFYDLEDLKIIKENNNDEDRTFNKYADDSPQYTEDGCRGWMKDKPCLITVDDLLHPRRTDALQKYLDIVSVRG